MRFLAAVEVLPGLWRSHGEGAGLDPGGPSDLDGVANLTTLEVCLKLVFADSHPAPKPTPKRHGWRGLDSGDFEPAEHLLRRG